MSSSKFTLNPQGEGKAMQHNQLVRRLLAQTDLRPDHTVVAYLDRAGAVTDQLTYAQLTAQAAALAEALRDRYPPATLFMLGASNDSGFLIRFWACQLARMTPVPVPMDYGAMSPQKADRLRNIVQLVQASALICGEDEAEKTRKFLDAHTCEMLPVLALDPPSSSDLSALSRLTSGDNAVPALVQFTSGSEARPKGVMLSAEAICDNHERQRRALDLGANDVGLNWMPLFHDMGLIGNLLHGVCTGYPSYQWATTSFVRKPWMWIEIASRYGVSFTGGPPFAFDLVLNPASLARLEEGNIDLSALRVIFCGAQPVPADQGARVEAALSRFGLKPGSLFCSYGLAETGVYAAGRLTANVVDRDQPRADNVVMPIDLGDDDKDLIKVVDPQSGEILGEGQLGEIHLCGASLSSGYCNDAVVTAERYYTDDHKPPTRWLKTGDLGRIVANQLFIDGRLKDIFFVSGRKIAASTLEFAAARHDEALNPQAAITCEDLSGGLSSAARITMQIELKARGAKLDDEAGLARAITISLKREFGVDLTKIEFVPARSLPRTPSGKIRRRAHLSSANAEENSTLTEID
jgi:acyl-CoA synthetase (AMP-forming)/AMP-acid ligase II